MPVQASVPQFQEDLRGAVRAATGVHGALRRLRDNGDVLLGEADRLSAMARELVRQVGLTSLQVAPDGIAWRGGLEFPAAGLAGGVADATAAWADLLNGVVAFGEHLAAVGRGDRAERLAVQLDAVGELARAEDRRERLIAKMQADEAEDVEELLGGGDPLDQGLGLSDVTENRLIERPQRRHRHVDDHPHGTHER
jgi:hypothetical protein